MTWESQECGGAIVRGQWVRVGEPISATEVLRRVWAVYRDGVFQCIKIHIESGKGLAQRRFDGKPYDWVFRYGSSQTFAPLPGSEPCVR
jgi:hypothetical protein